MVTATPSSSVGPERPADPAQRRVRRYWVALLLAAVGVATRQVPSRDQRERSVDEGLVLDGRVVAVWYHAGPDGLGDALEVWEPLNGEHWQTAVGPQRLVYREVLEPFVWAVSAWSIPGPDAPPALRVTLMPGLGISLGHVIIAEVKPGRWEHVFDEWLSGEDDPLESVDLDGDHEREIIALGEKEYRVPSTLRATVWKWSPARHRYVKVRESSYQDRLKPLHLKGFR